MSAPSNKSGYKKLSPNIYKSIMEVMAKANKASQGVLEENKKLGIPSPFSLAGRIYNLMPNGKIILRTSHARKKKITTV